MKTYTTNPSFEQDGDRVVLRYTGSAGGRLTQVYTASDSGEVYDVTSGRRHRVCASLFWTGEPVHATPEALLDVIRREYQKMSRIDMLKGFGGWR